MLRLRRPVRVAARVQVRESLHFLEKDEIGPQRVQRVAQLVHGHAPVQRRESLVDVVRDDVERVGVRGARHDRGCDRRRRLDRRVGHSPPRS